MATTTTRKRKPKPAPPETAAPPAAPPLSAAPPPRALPPFDPDKAAEYADIIDAHLVRNRTGEWRFLVPIAGRGAIWYSVPEWDGVAGPLVRATIEAPRTECAPPWDAQAESQTRRAYARHALALAACLWNATELARDIMTKETPTSVQEATRAWVALSAGRLAEAADVLFWREIDADLDEYQH